MTFVLLSDIADLQVGFAFKSRDFSDQSSSGPRLLRGDNIAQGELRWEGAKHWPYEPTDERYTLDVGDVVLAMDRPWVGAGLKFATVGPGDLPALLVQRVARLRAKPGNDQRYLHYVLGGRAFTDHILAVQTGTAVPHVSGSQIMAFRLIPRGLNEQRAIAEVLGALDDKIAANATLAGTAVQLADSEFAQRVRGIQPSQCFAALADIKGGGTPSTKVDEYWGGAVNWATPTDVTNLNIPYLESTSRLITDDGLAACASELHPAGSILMTSRATIGAFAIAQIPTAVNQGFIVVNAQDPDAQWWLFHEMRSRVPEFLTHANGATFMELSRGRFKALAVRIPDVPTCKEFSDTVGPLHARARAAGRESSQLGAVRDMLLPQLMSGKIRVRDAERVVEGVV